MRSLRIGIIGRTAYGINLCDGQTVKTRVLIEELKIMYPAAEIDIADTYSFVQKRRIRLFLNIIRCMLKDDVVFVLLSANGRKLIFPILAYMNKILKKILIHDSIGGMIGTEAMENPKLVKELNSFTVNYVESNTIVQELRSAGVTNAEYLPNFKRLSILNESQLPSNHKNIKLCTFSRVCEAKGITNAIMAVRSINQKRINSKIYLDIYGPIEERYEDEFRRLIELSKGEISYKGVIDPSESVDVLKDYYLLLFPTVHEGEGFPGTVIDAFHSGLPIIATDWRLNGEIIQNRYTGLLYDAQKPEKLEEAIVYLIQNPELVSAMRKHCIEEAEKYAPERVMEIIKKRIELELNK